MSGSGEQGKFPSAPFRAFWWGETVSAFGSQISLLALQTVVVLTLGGGAQEVGWLNSARWLPYLILGVVVGAFVDRYRRRPVMMSTDCARAVLLLVIPLAWVQGWLSLPVLLGVVALFGLASLVNDAASHSFVTRLVHQNHLQPAHARLDQGAAVAQTTGPALGGAVVAWLGAPLAIIADAASYLFSAVVVARLTVVEPRVDRIEKTSIWKEIREGLRWVYRESGLVRMSVATHVWFAGSAILGVALAPYILRDLGLSPFLMGICVASGGVGAVLGSSVTGAVGRSWGTGTTIIVSYAMASVGTAVILVSSLVGQGSPLLLCMTIAAGQLIMGIGMGMSNSHEMAYRQVRTPDGLQARTNITLRSMNRAVVVIGAPLAGLLAVHTGTVVTMTIAALVFLCAAGILFFSSVRADRSSVG